MKPGPWRIVSDHSCKTLEVVRWSQGEADENGKLSSELERAPKRFRTRKTAQAWIDVNP